MPWPAVAAAAAKWIPAIASLAGGLFSNNSAKKEARRQEKLQREFAQNSIRWRVADAKAAGLHPLYALTGQGASYTPVSVQDSLGPAISEAGQNVSRAISATSTPAEKVMQDLAIEQAKANIRLTETQQMALASEIARNRQARTIGLPGEGPMSEMGQASGATAAAEPAKSYQTLPTDAGTASGPTPLWRTFTLTTTPAGQDVPIVLPGGMQGDAAEVLESLAESPVIMAMVMKENIRRFGPSWGTWFTETYVPGAESAGVGINQPRKFRSLKNSGNPWQRGKGKFLPPRSGR